MDSPIISRISASFPPRISAFCSASFGINMPKLFSTLFFLWSTCDIILQTMENLTWCRTKTITLSSRGRASRPYWHLSHRFFDCHGGEREHESNGRQLDHMAIWHEGNRDHTQFVPRKMALVCGQATKQKAQTMVYGIFNRYSWQENSIVVVLRLLRVSSPREEHSMAGYVVRSNVPARIPAFVPRVVPRIQFQINTVPYGRRADVSAKWLKVAK